MRGAELFGPALAWLATYLLHSSVLLGLVWLLARRLRGRHGALEERLWRFAVLAPLCTASLSSWFPRAPLVGVIDSSIWAAHASSGEAHAPALPPTELTAETARLSGPQERIARDTQLQAAARGQAQDVVAEERVADGSVAEEGVADESHAQKRAQHLRSERSDATAMEDRPERLSSPAAAEGSPSARERNRLSSAEAPRFGLRRVERVRGPELALRSAEDVDSEAEPVDAENVGAGEGARSRGALPSSPLLTSSAPESSEALRLAVLDSEDEREEGPAISALLASLGARTRALLGRWTRPSERGTAALGAWVAIAASLALALFASAARLSWDLRRRRAVPAGPLRARFDALVAEAGLRRSVHLSHCDALIGPITFGVLRPEIVLPTRALTDLRTAHERSMLAHELAHVARRDPAWFTLLAVLERLFFFQPLLRVARRRATELAEERADDRAIAWTGDRLALAGCLAEIASWFVQERRRTLPICGMAGSRLGHRIERLLVPAAERDPRLLWFAPVALGVLVTSASALPRVASTPRVPQASPRPEARSEPRPERRSEAQPSPQPLPQPMPAPRLDPNPASVLTPVLEPNRAPDAPPATDPAAPASPSDAAGAPALDPREEAAALAQELALLEQEFRLLRDECADGDGLDCELESAFETVEARFDRLHAARAAVNAFLARDAAPVVGP